MQTYDILIRKAMNIFVKKEVGVQKAPPLRIGIILKIGIKACLQIFLHEPPSSFLPSSGGW